MFFAELNADALDAVATRLSGVDRTCLRQTCRQVRDAISAASGPLDFRDVGWRRVRWEWAVASGLHPEAPVLMHVRFEHTPSGPRVSRSKTMAMLTRAQYSAFTLRYGRLGGLVRLIRWRVTFPTSWRFHVLAHCVFVSIVMVLCILLLMLAYMENPSSVFTGFVIFAWTIAIFALIIWTRIDHIDLHGSEEMQGSRLHPHSS